jgi:hypothetical protein
MGLYVSLFCHEIYKKRFLQHHQPRTILYPFTQRTKESITWKRTFTKIRVLKNPGERGIKPGFNRVGKKCYVIKIILQKWKPNTKTSLGICIWNNSLCEKNERKFSAEFLYPSTPSFIVRSFIFKSAEAKRIIKSGLYRRLQRNCATIVRFHKY